MKSKSTDHSPQTTVKRLPELLLVVTLIILSQIQTNASPLLHEENCGLWTVDCGLSQLPTDSTFHHIKTIPIEAKEIQTDRLGNIFVVSKTNQLYKYSSDGKLLSTLNYKYLGNITLVDATNPLEVYVFYKELNMVVFLDNNLAYRGELALNDFNIGQAAAIARSFDNGIWIFDLADMQLKKMDKDGGNMLASGNMRQYTTANSAISYLYDNDERVFVNDSTNGIFVFDVFATYLKTLPIKGCDEVKVINNELFYHQAHTTELKKYQLKTFQTTTYPLPDSTQVRDISIEKNRLYLLKTAEVVIYGF
jgi:hypothetical protein